MFIFQLPIRIIVVPDYADTEVQLSYLLKLLGLVTFY